jgi:cyclophilin family peptidyl-prolyl cis-trans isomerase
LTPTTTLWPVPPAPLLLKLPMLLLTLAFCAACNEPGPTAADNATDSASDSAASAANNHAAEARSPADYAWPEPPLPIAILEIEGFGEIEVELYPQLAPSTVKNFLRLVENGFYEGTTFHRVVPGFMIQGGDPNSKDDDPKNDGTGGPGWNIQDEFTDAPHIRGVLSMGNTGRENTGGSQFFITQADAHHLDGKHSVFGRVTKGMEVVDAINAVDIDAHGRWTVQYRPLADVSLTRIVVRMPGAKEESAASQDVNTGAAARS